MTPATDRLYEALADRYAIEREIGAGGPVTGDDAFAANTPAPR